MRQVELTKSEEMTLEEGFKNHPKAHVRKRFHALLLSHKGWKVKDIAKLYDVRTRTIYSWMNKWEKVGVTELYIKNGRGLKPTLDILDDNIIEIVKKKHKSSQEV